MFDLYKHFKTIELAQKAYTLNGGGYMFSSILHIFSCWVDG